MTTTVAESTELAGLLERVARSVKKQFHGVEFDDLHQEAWVWALSNKRALKEHADNEGYLWQSARNHVAKYARQWLADTAGYDVEDSFFYSIPQLRTLLTTAFTPDWVEQGQAYDKQPSSSSGEPTDPANAWVAVADVKAGYAKLSQRDKDLLWQMLGEPGDPKIIAMTVAGSYGITTHVLQQRVNDALSRLRKHLGGGRPRD